MTVQFPVCLFIAVLSNKCNELLQLLRSVPEITWFLLQVGWNVQGSSSVL